MTRSTRPQETREVPEGRPPLLGSWRNLYAVVLGNLVLMVLLLWLITRAYS